MYSPALFFFRRTDVGTTAGRETCALVLLCGAGTEEAGGRGGGMGAGGIRVETLVMASDVI